MTKTTILRLVLLAIVSTLSYSCIHDETSTTSSELTFTSKEYHSKSLWKEDEVYIKNVKKIFETYADQNYFKDKAGEIAWDYALTAGEENLLEVPVIRNGKVNFILVVEREGDRIYFRRDSDARSRRFFEILVFKDRKTLSGTIRENLKNSQAKSNCVTIEKTVTWTDTQTGAVLQVDHFTEMHCTSSGPKLPCEAIDMNSSCGGGSGTSGSGGNGGGGSGGGGGYPYTQEVKDFIDNCKKVREQRNNINFKNNITNLEGKTTLKAETGYIQRTDGSYTYKDTAGQTNDANTLSLPNTSLSENKNIMGFLHTHVNDYTYTNADGDDIPREGIKMFSPADISYFMDMLKNAQEAGRPLSDVYAVMVTSKGNYQIRFTGNQYQIKSFTKDQLDNLTQPYITTMTKSSDLEFAFLNFISEKMNIKGVNLYKMDSNGTNYEIKLTPEKNKITSGCAGL